MGSSKMGEMKTLLYKVGKRELGRVLLHLPLGLLTCLLGYVAWWLALIFAGGFIIYELDEDFHIRNGAFADIKGFLWGCGASGFVWAILILCGLT